MRKTPLRNFLSLVVALAATLSVGAQQPQPPPGFTFVEVVGWDFSAFDERVREAVSKANAPGAGASERRAAAEALAERAEFFWNAAQPAFYKFALGDFRHVLRFRPDDAETRRRAGEIVDIYKSMARPVPTNGEAESGGRPLVELYRTTPKRLAFGPGAAHAKESGEVSERVAFVYEFEAQAGQRLGVELGSKNKGGPVFDRLLLEPPGVARALVKGERAKSLLLPSEGKYLIRVSTKGGESGYELRAELK